MLLNYVQSYLNVAYISLARHPACKQDIIGYGCLSSNSNSIIIQTCALCEAQQNWLHCFFWFNYGRRMIIRRLMKKSNNEHLKDDFNFCVSAPNTSHTYVKNHTTGKPAKATRDLRAKKLQEYWNIATKETSQSKND